MKERIWMNIPIMYRDILSDWSDFFAYESEDKKYGKLVVYRFSTDTKEYDRFKKLLEVNDVQYYIFRRVYNFTKSEKSKAEILQFWTDDDAKESYSPPQINRVCQTCGKTIPSINRDRLYVDFKKIKKYDIMCTYDGDVEMIVSEKIKQLFSQENISGAEFKPLYQLGKENELIQGFYHLTTSEGIGNVIEPSEVIKNGFCPVCGLYNEYRCKTTLNFDRETWKGLDICYTNNWFGAPPEFKIVIISNRLYKVLEQNKVKHAYFQPCYFIN